MRAIRLEKHLSQDELAALCPEFTRGGKTTRRHNSWISNIESGKNEPSLADVVAIAAALNVAVGWLITGEASGDSEFIARLKGMEVDLDRRGRNAVLAVAQQQIDDRE